MTFLKALLFFFRSQDTVSPTPDTNFIVSHVGDFIVDHNGDFLVG